MPGPRRIKHVLKPLLLRCPQPHQEGNGHCSTHQTKIFLDRAKVTIRRSYCGRVRPSNRYFGSVEEYLRLMSAAVTVSFLVRLGASEQQGLQDVLNPSGSRHLLEQWRLKFFLL